MAELIHTIQMGLLLFVASVLVAILAVVVYSEYFGPNRGTITWNHLTLGKTQMGRGTEVVEGSPDASQ
jgi:hypothetical protein